MVEKAFVGQLKIPEGISVDVVSSTVKVKGGKGELERSFANPRVNIKKDDNKIMITCREGIKYSQRDKMFINTFRAHIKNMFKGASEGYTAKLKICSGHFPMNVSVDGNKLIIKNFLGEKVPRKTSILDGVKVQVQGDVITVAGIDKDSVGQTAANIEQLTRITNKDRRVFQDGCYIILKPGDSDE